MGLVVKNLSKSYGYKKVLSNVSFELEQGQICGVKGLNGAGKSTLLACLAGVSKVSSGEVKYDEGGLSYLSHSSFLYGCLSVAENYSLYGVKEHLFGTESFLEQKVQNLSAGQAKRTSLCIAFNKKALLYLLDEPYNSLDKHCVEELQSAVQQLKEDGRQVVLTSHLEDKLNYDVVVEL